MNSILFSFAFALMAVLLLIPPVRKLAVNTRFVDTPGGRKQHHKPVPPIGGLVIFPVFMGVSLLTGADFQHFWPLYAGLMVLLAAGTLDEREQLHAWPKLVIQLCVAAAIVLTGHARLFQLGNLFGYGDVGLSVMSIPFSIMAVVLLVNAMNLIDGLDGLAGGYAVVVLSWLIFASFMAGADHHVAALAPLVGALIGFLAHNMRSPWRRKASVFLGDAGSMGLGLVLAWFCISLADQHHQVLAPISIAWILALPIVDTCAQFYRRIREGRHPFAPDRGHFHHHFIHAHVPVGRSVFLILALAFVLCAIGYFGVRAGIHPMIMTGGWVALLVLHTVLTQKPQIYIDFIKGLAGKR